VQKGPDSARVRSSTLMPERGNVMSAGLLGELFISLQGV
jgi:hypothetical protein